MENRQDGLKGFGPAANSSPARGQHWWRAPRKAPATPVPGRPQAVSLETIPQSKWRALARRVRQMPDSLAERLRLVRVPRRAVAVTAGGLLAAAGVYSIAILCRQPQDRSLTAGLNAWIPEKDAPAAAPLPEASGGVSVTHGRFVGEPGSRVTDLESMGSSELVKGAEGLRPSDEGLGIAFTPASSRVTGSGTPAAEPAAEPAAGRSRNWADAISSAARGISDGAKAAGEAGRKYSASASLNLKGLLRGMGALTGASYRMNYDSAMKAPELSAPRSDYMLSRSVVQTTLGLADSRPAPGASTRRPASVRDSKSGALALNDRALQPRGLQAGGATLAAAAGEAAPASTAVEPLQARGISDSAPDMNPKATDRKKVSDSESLSQQPQETAGQYAQKTGVQECIRFHFDRQRLALQESIANQNASKPPTDLNIPKECGIAGDSSKLLLANEQSYEAEQFMWSVTRPLLGEARGLLPAAMVDAETAQELAADLDGRLAQAQRSVPAGPVGQTLAKARASLNGSGANRGVLGGLADFETKAVGAAGISESAAPTCNNAADRTLFAATGRWSSAFDSLLGASEAAGAARKAMPSALEAITDRPAAEIAVARQAAEDIRATLGDPAFERLAKGEKADPKRHAVLAPAIGAQKNLAKIRNVVVSMSDIPFAAQNRLSVYYRAAADGGALAVASLNALSGPETGSRVRLRDAVVGAVESGAGRCEASRVLTNIAKTAGLSASIPR